MLLAVLLDLLLLLYLLVITLGVTRLTFPKKRQSPPPDDHRDTRQMRYNLHHLVFQWVSMVLVEVKP